MIKTIITKQQASTWQTWARWLMPLLFVLPIGILIFADMASAEGGRGLAELEGEIDRVTQTATNIKTKLFILISVIFALGSGLAGLAYLKSEGEGREKVLNVIKGIVAVYALSLIVGMCVPTS